MFRMPGMATLFSWSCAMNSEIDVYERLITRRDCFWVQDTTPDDGVVPALLQPDTT
jgi:hypothetical protein